jgi:hypothetical protein
MISSWAARGWKPGSSPRSRVVSGVKKLGPALEREGCWHAGAWARDGLASAVRANHKLAEHQDGTSRWTTLADLEGNVSFHMRQIFRKLDIGSRLELAGIVMQQAQ